MEKEQNYYSLKQVRRLVFNELLSISLIQKMVNANVIPHERYGGRILVPRYWVENKIKEANNGE